MSAKTPKVSIGTIKKIDNANKVGVILGETDLSGLATSGSAYFDLDETNAALKEGQLVQFVEEPSSAGPQAKRIMVLIDKK